MNGNGIMEQHARHLAEHGELGPKVEHPPEIKTANPEHKPVEPAGDGA